MKEKLTKWQPERFSLLPMAQFLPVSNYRCDHTLSARGHNLPGLAHIWAAGSTNSQGETKENGFYNNQTCNKPFSHIICICFCLEDGLRWMRWTLTIGILNQYSFKRRSDHSQSFIPLAFLFFLTKKVNPWTQVTWRKNDCHFLGVARLPCAKECRQPLVHCGSRCHQV